MPEYENKIDKIRKYFEGKKSELYPLKNTMLAEKEEYIKSLYLRMLCSLIRYTGEPSKMQVLYVRRLMAGINAEAAFEDYMKMALDLNTTDVDEFIAAYKQDTLKYYFCIDAIILLSVAENAEKNYELLAELVEMLGINREQLKYLSAAAKAIVMQSSELVDEAKKFLPCSLVNLSLFHYIDGFYTGKIVDTHEKFHVYSSNKAVLDLTNYVSLKAKQVIIENISASLPHNIEFRGCAEVVISNCKFYDSEYNFNFINVGKVIIENCEFTNFSNRVALMHVDNIVIRNNKFINCGVVDDGDVYGGVFYCDEDKRLNSVILENNELLNCYVERTSYSYSYCATDIFMHFSNGGKNIKVFRNSFIGCECRNHGTKYADFAYIGRCNDYDNVEESENVCSGTVTRILR